MTSPYDGLTEQYWLPKTQELIQQHPLKTSEMGKIVYQAWASIFESSITKYGFKIGREIKPQPQIMGFFLHELIALELSREYPDIWRRDISGYEKDLVYMPDSTFSIEIKTSSNRNQIFGNRSASQTLSKDGKAKKDKSGYYLAVNFEKFSSPESQDLEKPKIYSVRFGWIDSTDWQGQSSQTGQQARLSKAVYSGKLLSILESEKRPLF